MTLRQKRLLALFSICIIIIGVITIQYWTPQKPIKNNNEILLTHEKKEVISNYTKISVKPIKIIPNKYLVIFLSIESHQNPTLLEMNPTEITILEDENENTYTASHWQPLMTTPHLKSGQLHFPITVPINNIRFTIFDINESQFSWQL